MAVLKFTFLFTLLAQACTSPAGTQLIISPPKLEIESTRQVWYQIPSSGPVHKFELKCQASGDSQKYEWLKNGRPYTVDNDRVVWQRAGQSGTIVFLKPDYTDQGFYQCRASNIFGVAVSNIFEVKLGALDHFPNRPVREITVKQGEPLTLPCKSPYGFPKPSIFWLFRNTKQSFVIETIDRPHITVDGDGNLRFAYVEMHDGRENLLYQCAVTSPVLHGEYRAGDEVRLIVENRTLTDKPPKKLWFSPSNVRVTAGEKLKLMCIFSGHPSPVVFWWKMSGELPKDRMNHQNFGRTLIIKPVSRSDSGVYVCKAGDIEHRMNIEVTSAPQWVDNPPANFDLAEEGTAEIECKADGDPLPIVRWYKNGIPLDEINDINDRRTISRNGQILKITNLQHNTDRAVYQCNASNPFGYVFANSYVNVRAQAPLFLTNRNQTMKAVVGTTVDLDCSVNAAPMPKVKWMDVDNKELQIVEGKIEILENNTLRIYNLREHDADTYFCDVVNKFGMNQARRTLEVFRPTFFVTMLDPSERTLDAGEDLELVCSAESDVRLRLTYSWTKDGRLIDFDGGYSTIKKLNAQNRIRLTNVRGRDTGVYMCTAKTDVDEIYTSVKVIVKDVPDAPIITNIQCQETQALVNWTASFDNNDPIIEYIVEYATDFHPNEWKIGLTEKSRDTNLYEAAVNLSPWVNYTFRVTAANSYGRGPPGYIESVRCSTPPTYPYENPTNVSAAGTRKDNLMIYWKPMEKETWNAKNLTYLIRYRMEDDKQTVTIKDDDQKDWHEKRVYDPCANQVEIDNVPSYRKFHVQVIAENSMGVSLDKPKTIVGYSGEDVPSTPPKNFRVLEANSTHVKFSWDAINEQTVNGKLRGYLIKIWAVSSSRKRLSGFLWDVTVPATDTQTVVDGFQPLHSYSAHIVVYNSDYNSSPSDIVKFTTPIGPPGPVTDLRVTAYGSATIFTTWSPPENSQKSLTSYRIEYIEERDDAEEKKNVFEAQVQAEEYSHVKAGLNPQSPYTVAVWAETGGGAGPKISQKVTTYAEGIPDKPDFDIQTLDSKNVVIKWIPSRSGMPGTSFYVNYTRRDAKEDNEWARSQTVYLPNFYLSLWNLTPEVEFKFVLYAMDGGEDRSTPSDVKTFRTLDRTAEHSRSVKEQMSGAAWFIALVSALCIFVLISVIVCACKFNKGGKYPVKKKEQERGHNLENEEEKSFMEYQYGTGSAPSEASTGSS